MTAERQQFNLALALAAALNGLLVLLIAWAMAVTHGLSKSPTSPRPGLSASAEPDVISFVISPQSDPESALPERQFINSPDDSPENGPAEAATRFISSRNLRAATEEAAAPEGITGLATQQGVDKPFLDLRDSDFRDGAAEANRPPEAAAQPPLDPAALPPAPEPAPDTATPPAPAEPAAQPDPSEKTQDSPPEPTPEPQEPPPLESAAPETPEPDPLAFRDDNAAETVIPLLDPPPPRPTPRRTPAATPPAPPLTRIPDRVPETTYAPGLRKSKTLGTISNKGRASVDAVATAEGRFGKVIRAAIEKNWRRRMLTLSGLANPGLVEVEFEVDAKGRLSNVRLANPGEANPVMQDCALSAIIDAKLPPPPAELFEELRDSLTGGRMRCSFSFLIY